MLTNKEMKHFLYYESTYIILTSKVKKKAIHFDSAFFLSSKLTNFNFRLCKLLDKQWTFE
jgi:hypothetical protein